MKADDTAADGSAAHADERLVKELTGEILRRARERGWSDPELAKAAGKKAMSTFYGWRNKSRKNPGLLDLQAFARAVGLSVRLVADSVPSGSVSSGAGDNLRPDTRDVVTIMEHEKTSEELRSAIKAKVLELVTERASHPLDPGEDSRSNLARRK